METIDKISIKDIEFNKSPSQFESKKELVEDFREISQFQNLLRNENYISLEEEVIKQFIPHKFIANEEWENIQNINARILSENNNIISCECLIDRENMTFQIRSFPKLLFGNLKSIKINDLILVTIKTKKGSSRIDIRDGNGIVDCTLFDMNDEWEKLRNSGLDKPFNA